MRLAFLLLFSAAAANAACHSVGPNRWYCPSTGNPQMDGNDAAVFVSGSDTDGSGPGQHLQYACGDTIIFDSGKTYNTQLQGGYTVPWRLAARCPADKKVKLVGTRAAEMAKGYRPQMGDIPRMVRLQLALGSNASDCATICTYASGSGYSIDGFVLTTDHALPVAGVNIGTSMLAFSLVNSYAALSRDVDYRHILVTNAEQELFGPLEHCKTIECTLRGNGMGIHFSGINILLEDSSVYGLGGFLPNFGGILSASPFAGNAGTGYAVNDAFVVDQGQYPAVGVVDAVGSGGSVTSMHFPEPGWGYTTGDRGGYGFSPTRYRYEETKKPGTGWRTTRSTGSGSGLLLTITAGNTTRNVISGTNANPTVITSPGISAFLGIYPPKGTDCTHPVTGKPQCTYACAYYDKPNPGCKMVIVEGTPTGWDAAAGVKLAIYNTADSVFLTPPTFTAMLDVSGSAPGLTIDTTGAPPWGSVTARIRPADEGAKIDPVYNVVLDQVNNLRMVNDYFENGDMTIFGGNGFFPTSSGNIISSTFNASTQVSTVTLSNVTGDAKVGDILAAAAPGISKWCGTGGTPGINNCYQGGTRTGKITAISGSPPNLTFTMMPTGPMGIDVAVTTGRHAEWQGWSPSRVSMIRTRIVRSPDAFKNGKGPHEFKSCNICLFDGNSVDGPMFFEAKNQGVSPDPLGPQVAAVPWTTTKNVTVRNNWFGNGGRSTINNDDYEATVTQASNTWYENNFFMGTAWENRNDINSGWRHNTAGWGDPSVPLPDISITGRYILNSFPFIECGPQAADGSSYFDDYNKTNAQWYDNIQYYGNALTHGNPGCWPNETTGVHHNVWIQGTQTGDPNVAGINSSWPGNMPVANAAAVGIVAAGAICGAANWEQCALAPTSTFKGAASDGKDVGADMPEIKDHLNGWSEAAGLIRYEGLTATYEQNPAAFNLAATHATISFMQYGSPCSLILYTDRSRLTVHADTNTAGRQNCTRSGNLTRDGRVTFALGTNAALTPGTLYAYQLTTGSRVMVGEFRTVATDPVGREVTR